MILNKTVGLRFSRLRIFDNTQVYFIYCVALYTQMLVSRGSWALICANCTLHGCVHCIVHRMYQYSDITTRLYKRHIPSLATVCFIFMCLLFLLPLVSLFSKSQIYTCSSALNHCDTTFQTYPAAGLPEGLPGPALHHLTSPWYYSQSTYICFWSNVQSVAKG